ncbi:MAG: 4Fe-4S binding protein [Desulfobacteraceae bacterium]|jgi:polyferredoxin
MPKLELRRLRYISQIICFILFSACLLFAGSLYWPLPNDLFFRLDPIIAIIAMSVSGAFISGLVFSFVMLVLTFIFGRFFCGWICPLGTFIDFFEWLVQGFKRKDMDLLKSYQLSAVKFGILIMVVVASGFSFQFVYFFDPIVIMTRFMGMILMPTQNAMLKLPPFVVQDSIQFIFFTLGIVLLSLIARRFWCRVVCPLGALFGLVAWFSPSGFVQQRCKGCPVCQRKCRTGAILEPKAQVMQPQDCIRCFDCLDVCPRKTRVFLLNTKTKKRMQSSRLSRRSFLAWCGSGIVGSVAIAGNAGAMPGGKSLLRPPHAPDEEQFLDLCIRCQACVNICPTNALQPLLMQSGLYGLWSPKMVPSIGECRVDCNKCSTVCPTHAIGHFDLKNKYFIKSGTAVLFKNRCIPHADGKPCGKCIPKCPTGAIGYSEQNNLKLPLEIDFLLCVGCGVCQKICNQQTLEAPAIVVTAKGRNTPSGVPENTIQAYLEKMRKGEE